jgi:solute:Na+ symporter, SSS family
LYQPLLQKLPSDANLLRAARWAAAVGLLLSVGAAFAIAAISGKSSATVISTWLVALLLVFTVLQAPQLATFVVGAFTRRATGNGAFAGLVAGFIVALLHYGLTLPVNAQPGLQGGWLTVAHRYSGVLVQAGFTVAFSFAANLGVAWGMNLGASSKPKAELKTLVYPLPKVKPSKTGQKRPETLAAIVMLITLVLALVFA